MLGLSRRNPQGESTKIHPIINRKMLLNTYASRTKHFNPLMAVAAIWRFEVITRMAVCLNPADMYLYAFQCSMRLF